MLGTTLVRTHLAQIEFAGVDRGACARRCDSPLLGSKRAAVHNLIEDLVVLHMGGQPVAAQDEGVRGLQHTVPDLQFGIGMHSDRAGHNVPPRPPACLRWTEPSFSDQLLNSV